ncbi:methyltransferase family protein [Thermodesulfobacteriota bacterium]
MNARSKRANCGDIRQDRKETGTLRRIGVGLTKVVALFVILEPIWMLLPFAGFLYGSVFQIRTLNQNPHTAWLTHFVFPVLTLGWTGPVLILLGFVLFLIGAGQIYWAKIRRSGLVTGGLYRFVRHPQYVSLTLFGLGILLTWGRAITFIAFFVMMFLYYYLTKSEEKTCIRLFGEEYKRYIERTSYIIPGDKFLRPSFEKLPRINLPAPVRVVGAFAIVLAVCFGLMWLIQATKLRFQTVPHMTAEVQLPDTRNNAVQMEMNAGRAKGIPYVQSGRIAVVRGPYRNAWASGFAESVLRRIRESERLANFLAFLDVPGTDVAIVWCAPYEKPAYPRRPGRYAGGASGGRGPAPDPRGSDRVRLILMRCALAPGANVSEALADMSKRRIIMGCVAQVNLARPNGEDIVEADGRTRGPRFPGEERWAFFVQQFERTDHRRARPQGEPTYPGKFASSRLVLVQAPILRTRIDRDFAKEILDRLVASDTFRDRLRKVGAGGNVIPVVFPRPGRNWYREHHGRPQISLFVMLAQVTGNENDPVEDLFQADRRVLLSAFIVPMDFKIAPPEDSVGEATTIGRRRDLEERWRFFLSGLGAEDLPHGHASTNLAGR